MKKLVLVLLMVAAAMPALAQRRDDRRDRRDGGRVECTIQTLERGQAYGFGYNCREAINDAYEQCLRIVRSNDGRRRCANAGRIPDARFSIRCEDRYSSGVCRHVLPYSL